VVLAVNPYKRLDRMYGFDIAKLYLEAVSGTELPPHVYSVAAAAYNDVMMSKGRSQTILVSGESGAGKTETTKILMQGLTDMRSKPSTFLPVTLPKK